jgi:GMP synthase-like glutamine amidotransferase
MSIEELVEPVSTATLAPRRAERMKRRGRLPRRRPARRALLLQGADLAPGATLAEALRARSVEPIVVRIERGTQLPDPGSLELAVVIGPARWSGNPSHAGDATQVDWLREANHAGTPVLAVGTSSQLLATALGGGFDRAHRPRHSWVRVTTAAPELIAPGPWLAWEDAIIRLPRQAKLLAHDRNGPQAFRVNQQVGVQFHPEATPQLVTDWVANSDAALDHQGIMEATWRDQALAADASRRLFTSFVRSAISLRR